MKCAIGHWVNEALDILGSPASLDRADIIGRTFRGVFISNPLPANNLNGS